MSNNILITGAAGYIGGSILAEFLAKSTGPIHDATLHAAVRSKDQVEGLAKLGIKVIQLDIDDDTAVLNAVIQNNINVIVNSASSFDPAVVSRMIGALGHQRRRSGKPAYFVQSSVVNYFAKESGWPEGEVKDSDPLHDLTKQFNLASPLTATNLAIGDLGEEEQVTTFNVGLPMVYGRGTGELRKLSVNIPANVRASLEDKAVRKFEKDAAMTAVHISDATSLYSLIIEKAIEKESIPSGKEGYYFAIAHRAPQWKAMDRVAGSMFAQGLVSTKEVQVWPSHEIAAKKLGFPLFAIEPMTMCSGKQIAVNAYKLGWKPTWNEERFLNSIEDEVQAVLDLDTVKPTLFDGLLSTGR